MNHKEDLPKKLNYLMIVTSDSIFSKIEKGEKFEDLSGSLAEEIIIKSGNEFLGRIYVPNNIDLIRRKIKEVLSEGKVDVILVSGGTGLSSKDVTVEAISPIFEKTLPGFGELFRFISYGKIGTSAIASRATAGIVRKVLIFLLPGSPDAVKLALEEIILQEAPHLIKMIRG
ncbi:MAG: molybdenum cofactor biosynthesis protein MoaB [Candidatus Methanomethyliaceae archaeon]|nr:molybdenum cofactor biosynthesis protein MoaB [Candidatus Methanomethyliaceae archaeon]MDW7971214.1 molybdenum cofactor biosynthesis protein B [Nitrososphaerota archaeon]